MIPYNKDRDVRFHEEWLGLAQPIEGLVFSVPVLADAQITPEVRPELSHAFERQLTETEPRRIRDLAQLFREFLGYDQPGMLVSRDELPAELYFYAQEGGQEIRPSFAIARGPFDAVDPFDVFDEAPSPRAKDPKETGYAALVWDLAETGHEIDLDAPETITGPWRYPPTAKFERLLRSQGTPVGFIANGQNLRLIYAPQGESTAHLTFRVEHLRRADGRKLLAALELLLHARRMYRAAPEHRLEGLLAESRRRQADVTDELAKQVFEAVEILVAGFEAAAVRDTHGKQRDWLRSALETPDDHFYQGVLSVVLRLVFLLYAEDQSLIPPVPNLTYTEHLSLFGLYDRLSQDAGAHPESMHHRFGAYGQLLALFRAVYFGTRHGNLQLPPRRGRLFDPNTYPFLEGGEPNWTAAVTDPEARAAARPPSIDDGTLYRVLDRLIVFEGQRLSYRTLDVEQIGSVYESLMGYHVQRLVSPAVRIGKYGVWVETQQLAGMSSTERAKFLKETCGLNSGPAATLEKAAKGAKSNETALLDALVAQAQGKKADLLRHRGAPGHLVLQPGEERRRTGSHYTPRSLTEKVVKRTLEPLLKCLGEARTAEQILQLKICDPAMGSGAFLVAACRELAVEIETAWQRSGELERIIEQHGDARLHAMRLVSQQCLYGVDKNAAAVELAKLSLWLITLSSQLPFTFVDHALRHGDSLVGLDFKQITAFHWSPEKETQDDVCASALRESLEQAVDLRQQILELADHEDVASQNEKRRLFEFSQQAIDRIRVVADVCVGAFFAETKDAAREKERKRRLDLVRNWILLERRANGEGSDVGGRRSDGATRTAEQREKDVAAAGKARDELIALADDARKRLSPFHWWLEFPEVFFEERPDPLQGGVKNGAALMEGVVGNPPFLGGKQISTEHGNAYGDWLYTIHGAISKNADLSAHFFRRAATLLGENGAFGLIATNTVAQGDTRSVGLEALLTQGWILFDATKTLAWPGAAAVTVSLVHGAHGRVVEATSTRLDGQSVPVINSLLRAKPERSAPVHLDLNQGASFNGVFLRGDGFVLSLAEGDSIRNKSPHEAHRVRPFLGGEEVNSRSDGGYERYAIDLSDLEFDELTRFPSLYKIIDSCVRPYRESLGNSSDDRVHKTKWWRFARARPELYAAIAPLQRCLVTGCISKHLMFSFQPTTRIFSHKLYVFPLDRFTPLAVLQSRVHVPWAWLLSSTMKSDLNYSASDCFETFPFPKPDPRTVIPELESAGEALYEARAKFMVDTNQGLTKTYNALKDPVCDDPRILELRRLHEAMDRAVLDAYGWSDVAVPPYCPLNDADKSKIASFEDEIIDRLYVLNAERAAEEKRLGLGGKASTKRRAPDDDRVIMDDTGFSYGQKPTEARAAQSDKSRKGDVAGATVKGRHRDEPTQDAASSTKAKGTAKKPCGKKGEPEGQGSLF
jgi:hypothetical protein